MKKIHRVLAMLMAVVMALSLITTAFAEPTIDTSKKASLSIYKYDITTAGKDGAWDTESYVSTGLHDDAVVDKLAKYAIQGVEFTYLRVADITMNSETVEGQRQVGVLYGFGGSERSNAVLSARRLRDTRYGIDHARLSGCVRRSPRRGRGSTGQHVRAHRRRQLQLR